jgi:hypothetical protein
LRKVQVRWHTYLARRQLELILCQLFFATCFVRVVAPQLAIL